jgi:SAM-dependent methyltransferase
MKDCPNDRKPPPWDGSTIRALDQRYLDRLPAQSYRHYFDFVISHAESVFRDRPRAAILDIGCANGAFLHFVMSRQPDAVCEGIDALPELIRMAGAHVPGAHFATGDIRYKETLPSKRYTIVTMLTLHSHFDEVDSWLENVLDLVEPGGVALLYGPFNPNPVDVVVRLRLQNDDDNTLLPGWNMLARQSFEKRLLPRNVAFAFHDYVPPELPPVDDPLRTLDGQPILTNGAGLLLSFALLQISVLP